MALDHYIAQTCLKHWCDKNAARPLRAYRKSDGKQFPCWPVDVCTEPGGDVSPYLTKPDTLGQFRKLWEPRWNEAVDGFRAGKFTGDYKFVLSLGWASIMATTPTMTGIGAEILEQELRALLPIIARDRPPPPSIRLEDIAFDVDPKFAQALFTQSLPRIAWRLYLQPWTLLTNATTDQFLISDNPAAKFGENNLGLPPAALLPLAPDMCVTTLMDFKLVVPQDFNLADLTGKPCGKVSPTAATLEQARFINTLIVKHAEELVFSFSNSADVAALVAALRHLGVKLDHSVASLEDGKAMLSLARTGTATVR
jgi:Protein of unknown function (DUF4238)